ncbi:hypothetical protein DFA_05271 [Cavenderia fasciculata]|uniref:Uncharacterized protein n=1 Tax=Cavenderia fasciculata TaxID=261658 RepID=F4PNT8_CACFS|nr:uncharacterized protein DFA_05271 [Cavenderia fasciculata]EGG23141.1 hypothetical protein DFA_05271 [Cavenderia fasciculata]|eukprot:XP_004360992.1 hypothetical protein DFA_05271 [Cavenderia fasciculata]
MTDLSHTSLEYRIPNSIESTKINKLLLEKTNIIKWKLDFKLQNESMVAYEERLPIKVGELAIHEKIKSLHILNGFPSNILMICRNLTTIIIEDIVNPHVQVLKILQNNETIFLKNIIIESAALDLSWDDEFFNPYYQAIQKKSQTLSIFIYKTYKLNGEIPRLDQLPILSNRLTNHISSFLNQSFSIDLSNRCQNLKLFNHSIEY